MHLLLLQDHRVAAAGDGAGDPPLAGAWDEAGVVRHTFTHFVIELSVLRYEGVPASVPGKGEWWPVDRLDEAGLPTLFAKAARLARAASERLL